MKKFKITCPNCESEFNLTTRQIIPGNSNTIYFNEMKCIDYNDHTKLECPNCGYYETDERS